MEWEIVIGIETHAQLKTESNFLAHRQTMGVSQMHRHV
jgi:Asp-tRNA(Asn)/Glu-tRNA(Gln) amidotransferase B subunit